MAPAAHPTGRSFLGVIRSKHVSPARLKVSMRSLRMLLAIVLIALPVRQGHAQTPSGAPGRIVGQVVDSSGSVLPGVKVTLTGGDAMARQVVSDIAGRFAFDGVIPNTTYAIRGELAGFRPDEERNITIIAIQTRTITLELAVGCVEGGGLVVTGADSDLSKLLRADVVAHVRMGDAGEDLGDRCGPSREAVVLKALQLSTAGRSLGATIRVMGADRFERGKEYLVILGSVGGFKHPRVGAWFEREVVAGRIGGESAVDLDIRNGMRIEEALTRLQQVHERHRP